MPTFNHHDLALLNPSFDSPLVDVLTELEHLRRLQLGSTTPPQVFFQLKRIFHMLESLDFKQHTRQQNRSLRSECY